MYKGKCVFWGYWHSDLLSHGLNLVTLYLFQALLDSSTGGPLEPSAYRYLKHHI